MKKYIFIFSALFFNACVFGQNLKFSQIILVNNNPQTVPVGKVWKIEKIVTNDPMNQNLFGANFGVIINGTAYYFNENFAGFNSQIYFPGATNGPMWLPENTSIATKNGNSLMSIIEFYNLP